MAKEKIDSLFDIQKLNAEISQLTEMLKGLSAQMGTIAKNSAEMSKTISEATGYKEVQTELKKVVDVTKEKNTTEQQMAKTSQTLRKAEEEKAKVIQGSVAGLKEYVYNDIAWEKQMEKNTKRMKEVALQVEKLKRENERLSNSNKTLKKEFDDGKLSLDKYQKSLATNNLAIQQNKVEVSTLTLEQKRLIKETQSVPTAMEQLSLSLARLKKQYRGLTDEERRSARGTELRKKIKDMDDAIKELDSSIGDNQRNVGNYPTAMGKMGGALKTGMGQIMKFAGSLGLVVGASKLFQAGLESAKRASRSFGDEIIAVMTGAREATDAFFRSIMKGDWSNLIEKMQEAYEVGKDYEDIMTEITEVKQSSAPVIARIDAEIAKNMELIRNKTNEVSVRKKAIEDITKLETQKLKIKSDLIDKEIKGEEDKLKKLHNVNSEQLELMFGNIENMEKLHEARRLDEKITAEAKKLHETATLNQEALGDYDYYYNEVLQREIKYYDESMLLAIYANRKKDDIGKEDSKKYTELLAEKYKAEEDFHKGLSRIAEQKKTLETQLGKQSERKSEGEIDRMLTIQERQEKINKAKEDEITVIENTIKALKELNGIDKIEPLEPLDTKTAQEWAEILANLPEATLTATEKLEDFFATHEEGMEKAIDMAQGLMDVWANMNEVASNRTEQELRDEEMKTEARIKALDTMGLSEEMYAEKVKAINEDLDNRKKELATEEARRNKEFAIASATIDSALAIIKIWAGAGTPVEKLAYSVIVGATLATQIAAINSQPIPQYYKGRQGGKEEIAWTGEKGTELVYGKNFAYLTPDTATLTHLPSGASVIPHEKTEKIMNNISHTGETGLGIKLDKLINVIENKGESSTNITEKGIFTIYKKQNARIKYINSLIK